MDVEPGLSVNRIAAPITSLGPGRRAGLWVQGCTLGCKGCASTDTWAREAGEHHPVGEVARAIGTLLEEHDLSGLTISGGEPFQQTEALAGLLSILRAERMLDGRDVLIFTGYAQTRAQHLGPALWEHADAVVAGPYRADLPGDRWLRASSNQKLLLLTPLAHERYTPSADHTRIQVTASGDDLIMAGLPRPGDLDRFRDLMSSRGIAFRGTSWRS
jgi:anaerobic ribonucleoside-triphosphate reductase activating protein